MTERETTLFLTHCSGDKNGAGDPLTLYTSPRIQRFGSTCASARARWAIMSAKHALFFPNERHDPYNTQLSFSGGQCFVCEQGHILSDFENEAHVNWLIEAIRNRLQALGVGRVVFYVGGVPHRNPSYLLVVHRAVDDCQNSHERPNDVVECVKQSGKLSIANGMFELERELSKVRSPPHA